MPFATAVSLIGLAAVLFAVYRDRAVVVHGPVAPDWDALPAPADLGHTAFPLAVPGYDPATVDIHLDRLCRAYADLYAAAPEDVREAARAEAALHRGEQPPPVQEGVEDPPPLAGGPDGEPVLETWEPSARPGGQDRA